MKHIKNLCQATLKVLLAIAMVFSTGISGVFADEANLGQALEKQQAMANDLSDNKSSYETALSVLDNVKTIDNSKLETVTTYLGTDNEISKLLTAANNLDDNDPQTALDFINVVDPTEADANLKELKDKINEGGKTTISEYITDSGKELSNLSTLISSVSSNKESFSVSTLIEAVNTYKSNDDLTKLKTFVDAVNTYNSSDKGSTELSALIQAVIDYKTSDENLEKLKTLIESANELSSNYSDLTEDEKTQYVEAFTELLRSNYENDYNGTKSYLEKIGSVIAYIGLDKVQEKINVQASDATVTKISINGLEMDVNSLTDTIYVGYLVSDLEVIVDTAQQEPYVTVEINKPTPLAVGENTVTIKITTLSGVTKEYTYTVVRATADDEQGDGTDEVVPTTTQAPAVEPMVYVPETEEETTTSYVASSNKETEEVEDETEKKETKKDDKEYDEEVEEEKGLNGFTILLIVAGIALIGFGIYMLFGDKDDEKPINYNQKQKQQNNKKRK